MRALVAPLLLLLAASTVAQVVVSNDQLILTRQVVDAAIDGDTATVSLGVILENQRDDVAEGVVMVPLPRHAAVSAFTMRVGDRELSPELLDADRARQIYESILRRRRDPALLEVVGSEALRARVFPIPARGRVELTVGYSESVDRTAGLLRFQVPAFARSPAEETRLRLSIASDTRIGAVYSPTHPVEVVRRDRRHATVTYEGGGTSDLAIFTVYAMTATRELGVSLAAHRDGQEQGHFMLMLSPDLDETPMPKDIVFVLDRSGSMKGVKMGQAKDAVLYCIDHLDAGDRFAVVDFASAVETTKLEEVTLESRARIGARVDGLAAQGSTDIHAALQAALALLDADRERVPVVFLITDGRPTVGVTDREEIVGQAREGNGAGARIFTFGVGIDVDACLLDRIAADGGGLGDVVRPGERIDERTIRIFERVGAPVLADIEVTVEGVATSDLLPRRLPDLFAGGEIVLAGRYDGAGPATIRVRGRGPGGDLELIYPVDFPRHDVSDFEVARIWARRKIAWLLDQIRLQGRPEKELVDEIVTLSREYRVITPYTSFLISEDGQPIVLREDAAERLALLRERASSGADLGAAAALRALEDSRDIQILGR